jgi:hypothetical protein
MIELEQIKLQHLKSKNNKTNNKSSIKNFHELLQEKASPLKGSGQIYSFSTIANLPIEATDGYKEELLKRSKQVLKKLESLRIQILDQVFIDDELLFLYKAIEDLEKTQNNDPTFNDIIIRAKVELAKYGVSHG